MEEIDLTGIVPVYNISEFLRIDDGLKKVGISLVDEDGNFVNKYIYHPKYGYPGMLTDDHRSIFAANGQTETKCAETGKRLILYYTLECVCNHEDGTFNNKDGVRLYKKDFMMHQSHTAETVADFEKVFLREFKKSSIQSKSFFIEHELLKRFTEDYVAPIEKGFYKTHGRDLEIAYNFISWLKGLTPETMPKSDDDILFDEDVVRKVLKYNGIAFKNISETDLHKALNDPENFGVLVIKKNQSKLIGIIKQLESLSSKEWALKMLSASNIDTEVYRKKATQMSKNIKFD